MPRLLSRKSDPSKQAISVEEMFSTPAKTSRRKLKTLIGSLTSNRVILSDAESKQKIDAVIKEVSQNPKCFIGAERVASRYEPGIKVPLWLGVADVLYAYKHPEKQTLNHKTRKAKKQFETQVSGKAGYLPLIRGTEACIVEHHASVQKLLKRGAFNNPAHHAEGAQLVAQLSVPVKLLLTNMEQALNDWDTIFFGEIDSMQETPLLVLLEANLRVTYENSAGGHPLRVLADLHQEFSLVFHGLNRMHASIDRLQEGLESSKESLVLPSAGGMFGTIKMARQKSNQNENSVQPKPLIMTRKQKLLKKLKTHFNKKTNSNKSASIQASEVDCLRFDEALSAYLSAAKGGELVVDGAYDAVFADLAEDEFDGLQTQARLLKELGQKMTKILCRLSDYMTKGVKGVDAARDDKMTSKVFPAMSALLHDVLGEAGNCYVVMTALKNQRSLQAASQWDDEAEAVKALTCQIELFNAFVGVLKIFVGEKSLDLLLIPNVGENCVVSGIGELFDSVKEAIGTLDQINQHYQKMLPNDGVKKHFGRISRAHSLAENLEGLSTSTTFTTSTSDSLDSDDSLDDIEGATLVVDINKLLKHTESHYFKPKLKGDVTSGSDGVFDNLGKTVDDSPQMLTR